MNIPENSPIVFYFMAQDKETKDKISEFIENTKGVTILSMTDVGYFYNNFHVKQGIA